jgi:hypothetical protein
LRLATGNVSLNLSWRHDFEDRRPVMNLRNIDARRVPKPSRRLAFALCLLVGAGCAASSGSFGNPFAPTKTPQQQAQELEPMLEAAGFSELPAATPGQAAKLKTLPPLKLNYYDDKNGVKHYWVADPDFCKCLFHGDEASYQRYENLKLENQVAERDRRAVESQQMQQQQMMMGPGFGPPGIGFGGGSGFSFGGGGFGMSF